MRIITANNITLSRILLLPIPCYLVYGDFASKIAGLVIFLLLGLTDLIDGILARRHGTTVLGSILDPMADKMFIAATFIPLGDMSIIPVWTVFLILSREYAVTTMRSIFLEHKLDFKTSEIAKIKTNVQMGGAGFIFLTYIFKDSLAGLLLIGVISVTASAVAVVYSLLSGGAGHRTLSAVSLLTGVFLVRMILPPSYSIAVFISVVLLFTLLSGFQYGLNGWKQLKQRGLKLRGRHAYLLIFYSVLLPGIFVASLYYARLTTWAVGLILAFEFAGRGLENHVTYCGKSLHLPSDLAKSAFQVLGGLTALYAGFIQHSLTPLIFASAIIITAFVTCIYNCLLFYRNRSLLL